jgi:hypothetical protein
MNTGVDETMYSNQWSQVMDADPPDVADFGDVAMGNSIETPVPTAWGKRPAEDAGFFTAAFFDDPYSR